MDLQKRAENLAARPYIEQVILSETTDDQPIYISLTPELEGCISQGETIGQAISNLRAARIDFIYSLLEDGLTVPEPNTIPTITTSSSPTNFGSVLFPDKSEQEIAPIKINSNVSSLTKLFGISQFA